MKFILKKFSSKNFEVMCSGVSIADITKKDGLYVMRYSIVVKKKSIHKAKKWLKKHSKRMKRISDDA